MGERVVRAEPAVDGGAAPHYPLGVPSGLDHRLVTGRVRPSGEGETHEKPVVRVRARVPQDFPDTVLAFLVSALQGVGDDVVRVGRLPLEVGEQQPLDG